MTPEERLTNIMIDGKWLLGFWRDYKSGKFTSQELIEKWSSGVNVIDLMTRYLNLYMENQKLRDKLDEVAKILYNNK